MVRLVVGFPCLGINVTETVHFPTRCPTMALPRKTHLDPPAMMAMRILPFEVFGTAIDTADAIVFADTD